MRLILFDIDGTLIATGGAGMRALGRAFLEACGRAMPAQVQAAGMTDPLIVREAFRLAGVAGQGWAAHEEVIWSLYPAYLEQEMTSVCTRSGLLPGVLELLERLVENEVRLGLLTGNLEVTARIKLHPFGLNDFFPVGAYGSDCADRCRLGSVALERARRHYGLDFRPETTWFVGDTPRDIAAARATGSRVLAVGTGPLSRTALEEFLPDAALEHLGQFEAALEVLLG
ncbi:MAG: HAD family hydrolase [Candidatus Eremiobacteraeota bacterium]|nr:HAD family hydrolase [Candidatus Eremiobacteraeota bacterium]